MTDQANILRLLAGLVDPLLAPLEHLPAGAQVVQIACGTGQLSLELSRRRPDLRITAIDLNPAVLAVGRADAAEAGLKVDFRRMNMTGLEFDDGSVDAVISRMGLLLSGLASFEESSREAARVLRPQGLLSIATWTDLASSPYTGVGLPLLRELRAPVPDFEGLFAESSRPGALEGHLAQAGFREVEASWFRWETEYPDFDAWWDFAAGFGPLQPLYAALDEQRVRAAMVEQISRYRTPSGSYRLPATARLLTARA